MLKGLLSRLFGFSEDDDAGEVTERPHLNPEELLMDAPDCVNSDFRICLNVLTIADGHGKLMQRDIKKVLDEHPNPDVVFFLGDNTSEDIEAVLELVPKHVKMYGVVGNHDFKDVLEPYKDRITDVSEYSYATGNMTSETDYTIGGLAGSLRYKPDDRYVMLSNEESEAILERKPEVDILITHDKPCFSVPETLTAHSGLTGIGKYIIEKMPKIVLHGHLHERYTKRWGKTIIRSCYGVEMFTVAF